MKFYAGQRVRFIKANYPMEVRHIGKIYYLLSDLQYVCDLHINKTGYGYAIDIDEPLTMPGAEFFFVYPDQIEPVDDEDDTYTSTSDERHQPTTIS